MKRLLRFTKTVGWSKNTYADVSGPTMYHGAGLLWNWRACWVGYHYSARDKRLCVNLVPFLTIWATAPRGNLP